MWNGVPPPPRRRCGTASRRRSPRPAAATPQAGQPLTPAELEAQVVEKARKWHQLNSKCYGDKRTFGFVRKIIRYEPPDPRRLGMFQVSSAACG
ncbi:pre-mRNA-processing-splicing factor 8A-like [Triticum aestivum]|uniref:pre-mRNA-processing-splicing factor 8A-like n=1 Tax=Triticum aestivum TaxID=4565 RepID=UPI001D01856F|nr:pre-mRNA-processing-splicing factor 8A-like [Triticum aestivum]